MAQQLGDAHVFGFFTDLKERFDGLYDVAPLLPVLAGPHNRGLVTVCLPAERRMLTVYPEHLGAVLRVLPEGEPIELIRSAIDIAAAVLDDVASDAMMGAPPATAAPKCPSAEPAVLLAKAHGLLCSLAECVTKKRVRMGRVPMAKLLAELELGIGYMPHNAFVHLSSVYMSVFLSLHPSLGAVFNLMAKSLVVDDSLPLELAARLGSPIFVPKQDTEEAEDGESLIVVKFFRVEVFAGFPVEYTFRGDLSYDDTVANALVPTKDEFIKALKLEQEVREHVRQIASANRSWKHPSVKAIMELSTFTASAAAASLHPLDKSIKQSLQIQTLLGVLQSAIRMTIVPFSVGDYLNVALLSAEEVVTKLGEMFGKRMGKELDWIQKNDCASFSVKDVTLKYDDNGYGSATTKESGVTSGMTTVRSIFRHGATHALMALNECATEAAAKCNPMSCETRYVNLIGLWSVYNTHEFTEFGNMSVPGQEVNPAFKRAKVTTVDPHKLGDNKYVIKMSHGGPPNSLVLLLNSMRMELISAIAAGLSIAALNFPLECVDERLVKDNKIILCFVDHFLSQFLNGFFFKALKMTSVKANSFELECSATNSKGSMFFPGHNSKERLHEERNFRNVKWMAENPLMASGKVPARVQTMMDTYHMKTLIIKASEARATSGGRLFYLRPFFMTPHSSALSPVSVILNKDKHIMAPCSIRVLFDTFVTDTGRCHSMPMDQVTQWKNIDVYRIMLEAHNNDLYSTEKRNEWGGRKEATNCSVGINSLGNLVNSLADEAGDGKVTTSMINSYEPTEEIFNQLKSYFEARNQYEEDDRPFHTMVATVSETVTDDGPAERKYSEGRKREANVTIADMWSSIAPKMTKLA